MNHEIHTLSIQILDKTWQIRCPNEKAADLQKCALYLDNKIREISNSSKSANSERTIIMAAINVIYDLLTEQNKKDLYIESLSSHIRELQARLAPTKATIQNDMLEK